MPTVTVDAADLEALLFATSGIKDLEAALQQRKSNPLVKSGEGRLTGAHDRLSAAWRRANREESWPTRTVTEVDIAELRAMFATTEVAILSRYPQRLAQELLLVESGPVWEGLKIEWPAPADPEFRLQQSGVPRYAARLTHYGRQVLQAAGVAWLEAPAPRLAAPEADRG
ncbi:MAG: hypothetical protein ACLGP3_02355 [Acidobacteriota bacterium]